MAESRLLSVEIRFRSPANPPSEKYTLLVSMVSIGAFQVLGAGSEPAGGAQAAASQHEMVNHQPANFTGS